MTNVRLPSSIDRRLPILFILNAVILYKDDSVVLQAQDNLSSAYTALVSDSCTTNLTGQNLGGLTLTRGVYCYSSAASLSGTLTLNPEGSANALYVFQIAGSFTTSSSSTVVMPGGDGCDVFWQVGGAAVLGTKTSFGETFSRSAASLWALGRTSLAR